VVSGIKTRAFPEHNYYAIWHDGVTIRIKLNSTKPIEELRHPEFFDVKLTSYCDSGRDRNGRGCYFCYQDSTKTSPHFENVINKIKNFFGSMSKNEKPFQVAIGGGEPTSHPDFIAALQAFHALDICPNYTTNGMFVAEPKCHDIIRATKELCGGVAVSTHSHLEKYWRVATEKLLASDIKTNFHIIISGKRSIDELMKLRAEYSDHIKYFVLLPYTAQGRAKKKLIEWDYLQSQTEHDMSGIAFGANFYPYLVSSTLNISLYEPEILSKYLDLEGSGTLYKSSFSVDVPVRENIFRE